MPPAILVALRCCQVGFPGRGSQVAIAGIVDPATNFAPAKIAETYHELYENTDSLIEVVFNG